MILFYVRRDSNERFPNYSREYHIWEDIQLKFFAFVRIRPNAAIYQLYP